MHMKKIVYVTGSRAEYGLMKLTLKKLNQEFELGLLVTGMHLAKVFGETVKEIEKDGFKIIARIKILGEDTNLGMALSLGKGILGIAKALKRIKPDMVLVFGDRAEALAGAVAGAYLNIPVSHVHGGDQADAGAHIDDLVRHATTKFSHLHLAATKKSAARIKKMGEESWRVYVVGSPGIEAIVKQPLLSRKELAKKYCLDFQRPILLVVQHPVLAQVEQAGKQVEITLEALKQLKWQTVLIYPNADAGGLAMIKIINKYAQEPWLKIFKTLPRKDYLSIMKEALAIVGNSSSATIEAPALGIPAVNIGKRESIREGGGNKILVDHNQKQIIRVLLKIKNNNQLRRRLASFRHPYGQGQTSIKITKVIQKYIGKKEKLLNKQLFI
jgi:GDP/UDP-N,N'-diacetylbacillosamine 2-epimerase (hydrolysing)